MRVSSRTKEKDEGMKILRGDKELRQASRAEARYSVREMIEASLRGPVEALLHKHVGSFSWLKT